MGRYVVREAEEYYDMDDCDARGYPKKKIRYTGEEYETTVDPNGEYVESGPDGWEIHTVICQKKVQASPLTLRKTSLDLIVGEESTVGVSGNYSYGVKSSDKAVATAEVVGDWGIRVYAMSKGTATIRVTDIKSGQKASFTVTVKELCPDGNHPHMIDLGLPSGTKWACCNVGATRPEKYGCFYAWGETEEKDYYDRNNYTHCDGSEYSNLGSDIAGTKYDVAHVKWGGNWQMPSLDQFQELLDHCESEWTYINRAGGRKFTSKINGNTIFLPAGGTREDDFRAFGGGGYYLSSTQGSMRLNQTCGLSFDPSHANCIDGFKRHQGFAVRPVSK